MFPPGFEPGTFRVLGKRDDHYSTETSALACKADPNPKPKPNPKLKPKAKPTPSISQSNGIPMKKRFRGGVKGSRPGKPAMGNDLQEEASSLSGAMASAGHVSARFRTGDLSRVRRT